MIKVTFNQHQADVLARWLKSYLESIEPMKFDPTVRAIRHDLQSCLSTMKAAGAKDE